MYGNNVITVIFSEAIIIIYKTNNNYWAVLADDQWYSYPGCMIVRLCLSANILEASSLLAVLGPQEPLALQSYINNML